tara:strand:+ start:8115 stop:8618 length:504 start_codon:yes stop_codon:yes gene_type:complete
MDIKNKTLPVVLLFILITILVIRSKSNGSDNATPNIDNKPNPKVIIPKPEIPKLDTNIVYDDLEKAIALGKVHHMNVVLVFGADWCPYCKELKKDSKNIKELEKYIVCFLDTDNREVNQSAINKFKPRSLPTSLLLDTTNNREVSRKVGYRNKDYKKWLNSLGESSQ